MKRAVKFEAFMVLNNFFMDSVLESILVRFLKDGRYFEEIIKSDEIHPKVERF
jgi:hypothetical protein